MCSAGPFLRVYPRVYGGTADTPAGVLGVRGLSPRVRGNQTKQGDHVKIRGSIPACTGEPAESQARPLLDKVYPRVYGGTGNGDPTGLF